MDIEKISERIREEKDNLVAKAFTCQIASLLLANGIVPIMTEYRKEDLDSITDNDRYKLVYELGVTFDSLDTSEHDAKVINKFAEELKSRLGDAIYPNDFESMKNLIDDVREKQKNDTKWSRGRM